MSTHPDGTETTVHQEWRIFWQDKDGKQAYSGPFLHEDAARFSARRYDKTGVPPGRYGRCRVQACTVTATRTPWKDA